MLSSSRRTGYLTSEVDGAANSLYTVRMTRQGSLNHGRSFVTGSSVSTILILSVCIGISTPVTQVRAKFTGPSKSVAEVCSAARYPQECISSLTAAGSNAVGDQTDFWAVAVNSALTGIGQFYTFTSTLQGKTQGVREQYALNSCLETLQDSQDEMHNSLSLFGSIYPGSFKSKMTDVLTYTSAALTYHTTCLNGWDDSPGPSRDAMLTQSSASEILIANAVSLVASLVGVFDRQEGSHNRRLLSASSGERDVYKMDSDYPIWLRRGVRRLLQQTNPLTIYDAVVSQDGTGQYTSIQAAVDNAPQYNAKRYVIKINQGVFAESVTVPKTATNIMFIGDGMDKTVITGSKSVVGDNVTTYQTATVAINGRGFVARDMTFRNTAGAANHQAVAVRVDSDQSAFFRCSFEGYQDTLYAHTKRQFYKNCTMYGTIDYIFGNAAAVFQNCNLLLRAPLPGQFNTLTAQGRTIAAQNTGFSFQRSVIDAAPDLTQALATQSFQSYLGRPWKEYSRTVFLESYIGNAINPAGWSPWNGDFALSTLFYGEYQNSGPGSSFSQRVKWATQITDPGIASRYSVSFIEGAEWLPQSTVSFEP